MTDVLLAPWPAAGIDLATVRGDGRPCIFLVDEGVAPPEIDDELVDWVRMPAEPGDIDARRRALVRRAAAQPQRRRFVLDRFGRLHGENRWLMIHSTIERALLGVMLAELGNVSCFDELLEAGWPDGTATSNALRVQITRLNRRIAPLGLAAHGVRGVGYVLDDVRFAPLEPVGQ